MLNLLLLGVYLTGRSVKAKIFCLFICQIFTEQFFGFFVVVFFCFFFCFVLFFFFFFFLHYKVLITPKDTKMTKTEASLLGSIQFNVFTNSIARYVREEEITIALLSAIIPLSLLLYSLFTSLNLSVPLSSISFLPKHRLHTLLFPPSFLASYISTLSKVVCSQLFFYNSFYLSLIKIVFRRRS